MIKQAVILAAGNGKRIKEGTNDNYVLSTPKPLLNVRGTTIIERIVKKLFQAGLEIGIVINRKDETQFRAILNHYNITYCFQNEAKGTANALFSSKEFVTEENFLVLMGDDLSDFNMIDSLKLDTPLIFGFETEQLKEFGSIKLDNAGYAEMVIEKKLSGHGIANSGIYVMPKEFFKVYNLILPNQKNGELYLTDAVNLLYKSGHPLLYKQLEFWKGINRLKDLEDENSFHKEELEIRHAKMIDLYEIVLLLGELNPYAKNTEITEKIRSQLELIIQDGNVHLIVAEYHGDIVGTSTLLIQNNLSHDGHPYAHIENVVTKEEMRGCGIGVEMILRLIEIAKDDGCYKIVLTCKPENSYFYKITGFTTTGEVEMRLSL